MNRILHLLSFSHVMRASGVSVFLDMLLSSLLFSNSPIVFV